MAASFLAHSSESSRTQLQVFECVCGMRQVNISHNDRVSTESEADSPRGFLDKSTFSWPDRNRKSFLFISF